MSRIELETVIAAPVERCYDLSLSVEFHLRSTVETGERVVDGVSSGILKLGDQVTWEARHLGRTRRLSMTISAADPPWMFRDEMVEGPLRRLAHDHFFELRDHSTFMRDVFEFDSRSRLVDELLLKPYFRGFLQRRNAWLKDFAEGDGWRDFLPAG